MSWRCILTMSANLTRGVCRAREQMKMNSAKLKFCWDEKVYDLKAKLGYLLLVAILTGEKSLQEEM